MHKHLIMKAGRAIGFYSLKTLCRLAGCYVLAVDVVFLRIYK
jgi:hypothetical protein